MNPMSRRGFLQCTALGAAALGVGAQAAPRTRKPNVIFILTDEHRKDTLGCYGNEKAITPAFDSLAARGVRFDSCYTTQPVCSPCRSSLMTGLYPTSTGVVENLIPLRPDLFTWPRALKEQGYRTAYIGKWHLGTDPVPSYFDVWHGYNTGWPHWISEEPVYQLPGESLADFEARIEAGDQSTAAGKEHAGRYRPDLETDHAIEFIKSAGDDPFVCMIGFYPPHTPLTAPEEDMELHRGRFSSEAQDTYHAMVHRLDKNLARLLITLEEQGLREDTLIVMTSEHGHNYPRRWNDHIKRLCYDQSANVPLLMSWPGVLPEGREVREIINSADLVPTILELVGQPWPDAIHGRSAARLIAGDTTSWHKDILIQNAPYRTHGGAPEGVDPDMRERCVVTDEWKLILNTERTPELYRRHHGPPDVDNVFGQPETLETTRDLAQRLQAWGAWIDDPMCQELVRQWEAHWAAT